MKETAYIIWPDGMPFRHTIRSRIEQKGLCIVESRVVVVTRAFFNELYPIEWYSNISRDARSRLHLFNTHLESEMGIVRGDSAINKIVGLTGKYGDPALCKRGTIRRDFGEQTVEVIDDFPIHMKVIHRSVNSREARRDVRLIRYFIAHTAA